MLTRRVVPHRIKRLEFTVNVAFIGMTVAQAVGSLEGHPSLIFGLIYLLLLCADGLYLLRLRPRLSKGWPTASGPRVPTLPPQRPLMARYLAVAFGITAASTTGSAALALGDPAAGAALLASTAALLAVIWRMRWPME